MDKRELNDEEKSAVNALLKQIMEDLFELQGLLGENLYLNTAQQVVKELRDKHDPILF